MSVIQIGMTTGGNKKEYQALSTDSVLSFPITCGAGSSLITIDQNTHTLSTGYYFDGTFWNEV